MKKVLLTFLNLIIGSTFVCAQITLSSWQFDDQSGTNLNTAVVNGEEAGSWNFGGPQVQNGALNYGYTQYYKWKEVDTGSGSTAFRTFSFNNNLTSANYSIYTLEVSLSKWDLRRNWDTSSDSAAAKGIGFRITELGGDNVQIGFDTQSTNGFRAFSQGTGFSFTQLNGGEFDFALNRYEANGGSLRITGDLTTGDWTASAKDGEGGSYKVILSGTGITDIASISVFSKSPTTGSWGGSGTGLTGDPNTGGNAGDFILIDSITLTAVPEPKIAVLIFSLLSLGFIVFRRLHPEA
jgi:hypothetical protein